MVTFGVEKFDDWLADSFNILENIWEDEWKPYKEAVLDIDMNKYLELDRLGLFKIICGRTENQRLVAFWAGIITPNFFCKNDNSCYTNFYWVDKEFRGITPLRLIKFIDQYLKDNNVDVIYLETRIQNRMGKVLEHIGYEKLGSTYLKVLK